MADRAKKISELDALTTMAASDLLVVVANAAGNGVTKSITFQNLMQSVDLSQTPAPGTNTQISYNKSGVSSGSANLTFDGATLTPSKLNVLGAAVFVGPVTLGTIGSGATTVRIDGAIAANVLPDTPNNYTLGSPSHPWGTLWASTIRTANLSYQDTNIVIQMAGNTASYIQAIVQNTSNAANASVNYNVSGDTANSTANYGEYGINSSTFSGSGPFSHPSAVYLAAATSNLAIGTYDSHPVNIVVNSSDVTTWTYGIDGSTKLPGGPVVFTGNATTRAAVNTQVGSVGSNGSLYLSTAGKMYLRVDVSGVATTDWQRVSTTAAD